MVRSRIMALRLACSIRAIIVGSRRQWSFAVKIANGATVDESTYGGGIRVEKSFNRFRPYADFLISGGSIDNHIQSSAD